MKTRPLALAVLGFTAALLAACATPPRHPAYLHALSDLRAARWGLEHRPGDAAVSGDEDVAIVEVDRAINEAKKAAYEDGQNTAYQPPPDATLNRTGRLHQAAQYLHRAKDDVAREEDNPESRDLRHAVVMHIDQAIRATDRAIHDVEQGR
jgi:hypothetical protein